eukprot:NODE_4150_length_1108_cov_194.624365_g3751_i1.p1 GENE.NODE_4150_length_1108_cov_194.624365_g3751_i1~~NODE_4150_length_1108_cov_194.624365_g3751_i1.p1  ORF type:complete len:322 (+),score=42.76 NODE_4150_length_1108_cov_194.624365_g3751_i1:77-1042(+)
MLLLCLALTLPMVVHLAQNLQSVSCPPPVRYRHLRHGRNIFYSQYCEDCVAFHAFFKEPSDSRGGFFVEAGALDGLRWSNTLFFEITLGWKGLLIEGNPRLFPTLRSNRPNAVCVNAPLCQDFRKVHYSFGGSDDTAGIVEFMSPEFKGFWHRRGTEEVAMTCRSLDAVLKQNAVTHIDFLSLDVEGSELEVLQTVDFQRVTVDIMVIEADPTSPVKNKAVQRFLLDKGYELLFHLKPNDWFIPINTSTARKRLDPARIVSACLRAKRCYCSKSTGRQCRLRQAGQTIKVANSTFEAYLEYEQQRNAKPKQTPWIRFNVPA